VLEALLACPAIVKVLTALALILVVSRLCRHLIVAVVVAAAVLGLWAGYPVGSLASIAGRRLVQDMPLLIIVAQVMWLSSQMAATGVMSDLVKSVRARVSRHASMAVLPAVIGLLPMPGGALFSAPLVDGVDETQQVPAALKAQTNHWFRHIWEYWWPLYPGVLLAVRETGLEFWQFMAVQLPMTCFAICVGNWFLLRRIGRMGDSERRGGDGPRFLPLVLPIMVVVAGYASIRIPYWCVQSVRPVTPDLNKYVPMMFGLFAAMLLLVRQRPLDGRRWREVLLSRRILSMLAIVVAVRLFGALIKPDNAGVVGLATQMRADLEAWGLSALPVIMVLPFLSGLSTGLAIGFVGASFPVVMATLGAGGTLGQRLATVVLAYGFGYIGMLVSPVHVCLVVTSRHFGVQPLRSSAALLVPGAVVLLLVLAEYFVLLGLLG
jgi:integral membrane protein (TIGR00529 family)